MPRSSSGSDRLGRPVDADRIVRIVALHGVVGEREIAVVRASGPR